MTFNLKRDIKKSKLILISFLAGTFSTTPTFIIKSFNNISYFSFIFIIFNILLFLNFLINKRKIIFINLYKDYFIWLFLVLLSHLFGLLYFINMKEWFNAVESFMWKVILYFVFFVLLQTYHKKELIANYFFYGLLVGIILNVFWSILDGVLFYIFKFSINNLLFSNYISTFLPNRPFMSIVRNNTIRTSGFNYDPAHLGGLVPILLTWSLIKNSKFLFFSSILALLFSQSTTGLVTSLILIALNYKKIIKVRFPKFKIKTIIIFFFIILIILINIQIFTNLINIALEQSVNFLQRSSSYFNIEEVTNTIRFLYLVKFPYALIESNFRIITGTGFTTSSYGYVFSDNIEINESVRPFDPENTYIAYFFDLGIIGFILYIRLLGKSYKFYNRNWKHNFNAFILSALGSIIISNFFYHYTFTAYRVLSIMMALIIMNKKEERGNNKEGTY